MGLWMIQNVKKEFNDEYSFVDLANEARKAQGFNSLVDVNDQSFFAPKSMTDAIKEFCKKTGQQVPETVGEISLCVYASLAREYDVAIKYLDKISNSKFDEINIVGGGCQNVLLNELTAKSTGKKVVAGPVEATAIGNLLSQMLYSGDIKSLKDGKELIKNSFEIKEINC
jgi:rhamnulokinase